MAMKGSQGEVNRPQFKSEISRKNFENNGGPDLITNLHKNIFNCGKNYATKENYDNCIDNLEMIEMIEIFKTKIKEFVVADFKTESIFHEKYNKTIVEVFSTDKEISYKFFFNFIAIFIFLLSFGIVYAINFYGQSKKDKKKKATELITEEDLAVDVDDNENNDEINNENENYV